MRNPFRRIYEIDPFPIRDRVTFRNGEEKETFTVRADDSLLVVGLNKAQKRLAALNDNTDYEEQKDAALFFAGTIFGKEQAEKILQLYDGDPLAVIAVCGRYFQERLSGIITKAQKKK